MPGKNWGPYPDGGVVEKDLDTSLEDTLNNADSGLWIPAVLYLHVWGNVGSFQNSESGGRFVIVEM